MSRHTRFILLAWPLLAVSTTPVQAQDLKPDDLVRWQIDGRRIEGRILGQPASGAPLRVMPTGGPALVNIPQRLRTARDVPWDTPRLERRIRPGRRGSGALLGVGVGLGLGVVAGLVSGDDPPGWFAFTKEEKAVAFAMVFAPMGAALGALTAPGAVWRPVEEPRTAARQSGRVRLHLGVDRIGMRLQF